MTPRAPRLRLVAQVGPFWLVMLALLIVPLVTIVFTSFLQRGTYGGIRPIDDWRSYIESGQWLANYRRSFDPLFLKVLWRSVWMALVTVVICLLVSYPVAYYIALVAPPRRRSILLALTVVPFWTSFLVRTYAWMLILREQGLINVTLKHMGIIDSSLNMLYSPGAVLLGLVYGELPFMILPIFASLEKMDRTLFEASADLGASRWSTFWRVTVPLSAPGMAAGVLLVFVPSIGQFVVSDLLGGARSLLIGNVIQNQFTTSRDSPFGSALAVELTMVVMLMLVAYLFYTRRRGGEL